MKRLRIPPTKSGLLALRRQVLFLEEGHGMLERKRELLARLVYERLGEYRRVRAEARRALEEAYRWLALAQMRMGSQVLRQSARGLPPALDVNILPRSNVGVEYPAVTAQPRSITPVGLMWTDPTFDHARERLQRAALLMARLGELETAMWRLLAEQRKTQKRVNALKYNVIPRYHATIHFIQSALEEEERNTLFQIKVLREQAENAGRSANK
ncbi:MAG TPA: V-type ATP synthase subunit D [Burkholderiales bacterium]|nr:V-type ATP synthase subunit D [Burkholderiales bacterium]